MAQREAEIEECLEEGDKDGELSGCFELVCTGGIDRVNSKKGLGQFRKNNSLWRKY